MKRTIILFIFSIELLAKLAGQIPDSSTRISQLKSIEYSDPDLLPAPAFPSPGFPSRAADLDALPGFKNPPPGYGEVPFWWWSGDPLDKERLLWEIEELHKKGIGGMQINYIHKDTPGWPTYPADPEIFSDRWWEMWKFAADEAGKRSMGIGMSGYTIDWPNSENLFSTLIYSVHEIEGQELVVDTIIQVKKGDRVIHKLSDNVIQAWAYMKKDDKLVPGGKSLSGYITGNQLTWMPDDGEWVIWIYGVKRHSGTLNPIHPLAGKTVIEKFFQQFEDHADNKSPAGLNYFFQDELKFGVGDLIWTDDLDEEFRKSKGYEIFETLPGMFTDIGPLTAKARLDFMDVKVMLSEERYFKPIFEWHWKRGMIYGCDPEGRGRIPGNYGDNFRAIRWYSAPGHDTPSGKADLIKGKVSSSIAALYKRPRVWLEGYHSLGWGATPEQIMFATNENYLYGCNLLNLHGLYYSTHGSYWEWAPPCYHFRMPYWDHMTVFLKYFERLSYLLSQGVLQTDIAIIYPVSTSQAAINEDEATETAFRAGTDLFNNGYDFLFMDDQSLIRSDIRNSTLNVSDQSFKILVLPALKAIRWSTITRALEFFHNGGTVLALGSLPEASDHAGSHDPELDDIVRELFGASASEMKNGKRPFKQIDKSGGTGLFISDGESPAYIAGRLLTKHVESSGKVRFMHRKVGYRDVFMVMGAGRDSWLTFRVKGKAELWDPWTGNNLALTEVKDTIEGTMVKMPLDSAEAQVIVFTPREKNHSISESVMSSAASFNENPSYVSLDGEWEFELKPTMNNQWGDFRLPVTEKMIGAEARIFRYSERKENLNGWELAGFDDSKWAKTTNGYGQKFWKLGPLPAINDQNKLDVYLSALRKIDPSVPVIADGKPYYWTSYDYSWRFGVEGDPGHQGYHGLKEEITDEFICLGKPVSGLNETLYEQENEGSMYYLWTSAYSDNETAVTIDAGGLTPSAVFINGKKSDYISEEVILNKGSNPLLIRYEKAGRGHFVILKNTYETPVQRTPLSMKWWDMNGIIPFDVMPSEKSPAGFYRFTAPPGLQKMTIRATGRVTVFVDGKQYKVNRINSGSTQVFETEGDISKKEKSVVAIIVEQTRGEYGGSALPDPVLLDCGTGVAMTGDWSVGSVLENYSGGAWYRKKVFLSEAQSSARVVIDLGRVVATAEVHVNDSLAGILVAKPWKIDITKLIRKGENKIEILVYNTLANHYLTIPTRYRGNSLESGLIGPVRLECYMHKNK